MHRYAILCSSMCSLRKKHGFKNIPYNPSQWGFISSKPSTGGFWMFMLGLTWTVSRRVGDATRTPQIWLSHWGQQMIATIVIWPSPFNGWSLLTYYGILPQRTSTRTLDEDRSKRLSSPAVANYNVSKTKSLMSCIQYAAPVTCNNIIHWDARQPCLEMQNIRYCMELFLQ